MSGRLNPNTERLLMRLLDRGVKPEVIERGLAEYIERSSRQAEESRRAREEAAK